MSCGKFCFDIGDAWFGHDCCATCPGQDSPVSKDGRMYCGRCRTSHPLCDWPHHPEPDLGEMAKRIAEVSDQEVNVQLGFLLPWRWDAERSTWLSSTGRPISKGNFCGRDADYSPVVWWLEASGQGRTYVAALAAMVGSDNLDMIFNAALPHRVRAACITLLLRKAEAERTGGTGRKLQRGEG